uniref:dUTPase-like domain-containing protein n=1 Tax=Chelonoidis abingdonii TaxID=106734 RepID=A0A8C0HGM4_CHEAB
TPCSSMPGPLCQGVPSAIQSHGAAKPVSQLRAATTGSAGLDLIMQQDTEFTLPGEVHVVETQAKGPLPAGMVGHVLPRSHAGRKGFFVIPGVIDPDYQGIIKVQVWTNLPQTLPRDQSVAQLILVPYSVPGAVQQERGDAGFGSTLIGLTTTVTGTQNTLYYIWTDGMDCTTQQVSQMTPKLGGEMSDYAGG